MKLLLDENLPHDLRHFLPGHDVSTVAYMGWAGISNGRLLATAAAAGFDVLVSLDSGIAHEQNIGELPLSVVLIRSPDSTLQSLRIFVPELLNVLDDLQPRTLARVGEG